MAKLEKKLFRKVKRANLKYQLITDHDRIAVGLSGGKDSLVLLYALQLLKKYTPLQFDFIAITIDLGMGIDYSPMVEYCNHQNIPLVIEPTNIGRVVFQERQEKNPCSLCANLRHGALHRVAQKNNCNKVALAHHLDDAVTTMLMSMAFEGQLRVFLPATYLDRSNLTAIRPLIYVSEKTIYRLCCRLSLPVIANTCPNAGQNKRVVIQSWLETLEDTYPGVKKRFLTSLEKIYWNQ